MSLCSGNDDVAFIVCKKAVVFNHTIMLNTTFMMLSSAILIKAIIYHFIDSKCV